MNALFELIGKSVFLKPSEANSLTETEEYTVEISSLIKWSQWAGYVKVSFNYKSTSQRAKKFVDNIAFAKIQYGYGFDEGLLLTLRSNRTREDELEFLEGLASINYDNGYGGQELFGTIVYKDGTWLERGEYDGSEWWECRQLPTEESLFGE